MAGELENHEMVTANLDWEEPGLRSDIADALVIWLEDPFNRKHPLVRVHVLRGAKRADTWVAHLPYGWRLTFQVLPYTPPVMRDRLRAMAMLKAVPDA